MMDYPEITSCISFKYIQVPGISLKLLLIKKKFDVLIYLTLDSAAGHLVTLKLF